MEDLKVQGGIFLANSSIDYLRLILYCIVCLVLISLFFLVAKKVYEYLQGHLMPFQKEKVEPHINNVAYQVSYWTEKGGRPYQEDRHHEMKGVGAEDSSLYGVFDGHGGSRAAQYCKDYILQCIVKDPEFAKNPAIALKRAFFK